MNIESLMKHIESLVKEVIVRRQCFTGSLTLVVNFFEGEPKEIVREIERIKEKTEV